MEIFKIILTTVISVIEPVIEILQIVLFEVVPCKLSLLLLPGCIILYKDDNQEF